MSNGDLMKSLYEAFAKGDLPAVLGAMSPKIEWREAESNPYSPKGEAWIGPDAVVANLFAKLVEEWESFEVHTQKFHDAGSTVTVEGRYTGTYKSTGKKQDTQFCHVWTLANGEITHFQQYTDTAQLQDIMGARV